MPLLPVMVLMVVLEALMAQAEGKASSAEGLRCSVGLLGQRAAACFAKLAYGAAIPAEHDRTEPRSEV